MSSCEKIPVSDQVGMALAQEFLAEGMKVLLPLKGNSMLPFIRPGKDLALVDARKDAAPGDVVLARSVSGKYVIHRVVKKNISELSTELKRCLNLRNQREFIPLSGKKTQAASSSGPVTYCP